MAFLATKSILCRILHMIYRNLGNFLLLAIPNLNNAKMYSYFTYISSPKTYILLICCTLCSNFFAFLRYLNIFLIMSKYTYKFSSLVLFPCASISILLIFNLIKMVINLLNYFGMLGLVWQKITYNNYLLIACIDARYSVKRVG